MAILVEQYRFLRAICTFHSRSENETMLPVAQQLSDAHKEIATSCHTCEQQHIAEAADFDALGQLLADVRSCTRRGGREASVLAAELCKAAEAVRCGPDLCPPAAPANLHDGTANSQQLQLDGLLLLSVRCELRQTCLSANVCKIRYSRKKGFSGLIAEVSVNVRPVIAALLIVHHRSAVSSHMALEEAKVFPVLAKHCSVQQQRLMVWNTIRAMPLRLLERMLPWVASY
eukprot:scaffold518997_cov44-Prasinocladus_malaysianus.AAC.1